MSHTLIRNALLQPHGSQERFDPEFPVLMRCEACGKHAYGPRKHMSEALREHRENQCSARSVKHQGEPLVARVLYPRL